MGKRRINPDRQRHTAGRPAKPGSKQTTRTLAVQPGWRTLMVKRPAKGQADANSIRQLQHHLGNRWVQRLMRSETTELDPINIGASGPEGGVVDQDLASRIHSQCGQGTPLSTSQQSRLEHFFETRLNEVRLHTDQEADLLNQELNAKAFTIGSDIFFSSAAEPNDKSLLAHELTHVVQQSTMSTNGPLRVGAVDDQFEQQADQAADQFAIYEMAGKAISTEASGYSTSAFQLNAGMIETESGPASADISPQSNGFSQSLNPVVLKPQATAGSRTTSHLQRDWLDDLGNIAGVEGLGNDIVSTVLTLGDDAGAFSSGFGGAAGVMGLGTGLMGLLGEDSSVGDRILGGMSTAGGISSLAGTASSLWGSGALSVGGATGLSATMGTATSAGGAGLASMGAGALATSTGALLGAGAAGYGAGTMLSEHTRVGDTAEGLIGDIDEIVQYFGGASTLEMADRFESEDTPWYEKIGYGAALGTEATVGALASIPTSIGSVAEDIWDLL